MKHIIVGQLGLRMQKQDDFFITKLSQIQRQGAAAITIQKWFRGTVVRIETRKLARQMYIRRRVIQEMMETEQNYIRDLALIATDFKMKLQHLKAITPQQVQIIFSNIDQIRRLNEQFYVGLSNQHFPNTDHFYKQIFKDAHKQISFFKIYFEYFNNFTKANALISELREHNPRFVDFLDKIASSKKYMNLQLNDYLIKPIQRLPKYVILLKELKKRTPEDHPDFKNISQLLQAFEEVNNSNNEKLNKMLNNYKLSQLERDLSVADLTEPGIDFVGQEPVTILTNEHKTIQTIMYLLNNQILLRKQRSNQLTGRIKLTQGTSLLQDEDGFYFKNTLTVQDGEGNSFTIVCSNLEEKKTLFSKLSYLIFSAQKHFMDKALALFENNLTSESFIKKLALVDLIPEVTILGTAERQAKLFKYTVYIVQVKVKVVRQKIFVRYSEVAQIQEYLRSNFPEIEIKQPILVSTWLLNHKPKTIEQRKMNIQRFLKQVLSKPEIIERGQAVLYRLGLPFDFYELPSKLLKSDQYNLHKSSRTSRGSLQHTKSIGRKDNHRMSVFLVEEDQESDQASKTSREDLSLSTLNLNDLLKANENLLGHFERNSENVDRDQIQTLQDIRLEVFVPFIEDLKYGFQKFHFSIKRYNRVSSLLSLVARELELLYFKDFRLVLERSNTERMIDGDQIISKVYVEVLQGEYRIVFKKVIFVDPDMEIKELVRDQIRLRIIASQVVNEISKRKYHLQYNKYLLLAVLVGIIVEQQMARQNSKSEFMKDRSRRASVMMQKCKMMILPKYTCIENSSDWDEDYKSLFANIKRKLSDICEENVSHIRRSSLVTQDTLCDVSTLAHFAIIQEIQFHHLYGAYLFVVQADESLYLKLKKQRGLEGQSRNIWLAVNYKQVMILSLCSNVTYYSYEHEEVSRIDTYTASITLSLRGGKQIRLKTTSSYQIREFILYYKNYQGVLSRVIKDPCFCESIICDASRQKSEQGEKEIMRERIIEEKYMKVKRTLKD